jgi:hypothetical protein
LYNLKLMDSFMKESQRLSPVTLGKYWRNYASTNHFWSTFRSSLHH